MEILAVARKQFDNVFRTRALYRSTGIVLAKLVVNNISQPDLFGQTLKIDAMKKVYKEMDRIDAKYGKHTIFLGSSFKAIKEPAHNNDRGIKAERMTNFFKDETSRRRLGIPMLGEVS